MSRDPEAKVDPKTARLLDKRTVERNIKKGLISRKDYEKYLKSLDDIAEKGVYGGPAEEPDDDEPDIDEDEDEDEGPEEAPEGNSH
jgi:hypothetical protein